jgi:hypothetical protein
MNGRERWTYCKINRSRPERIQLMRLLLDEFLHLQLPEVRPQNQ